MPYFLTNRIRVLNNVNKNLGFLAGFTQFIPNTIFHDLVFWESSTQLCFCHPFSIANIFLPSRISFWFSSINLSINQQYLYTKFVKYARLIIGYKCYACLNVNWVPAELYQKKNKAKLIPFIPEFSSLFLFGVGIGGKEDMQFFHTQVRNLASCWLLPYHHSFSCSLYLWSHNRKKPWFARWSCGSGLLGGVPRPAVWALFPPMIHLLLHSNVPTGQGMEEGEGRSCQPAINKYLWIKNASAVWKKDSTKQSAGVIGRAGPSSDNWD